jgi:hypothetical protein
VSTAIIPSTATHFYSLNNDQIYTLVVVCMIVTALALLVISFILWPP